MKNARDAILRRIREGLNRADLNAEQQQNLQARFIDPPLHPRVAYREKALPRFIEKLLAAAASVVQVKNIEAAFTAIDEFLQQHHLGTQLLAAPALQDLAWPAHFEMEFGASDGSQQTAVTPCYAGIAESGSLALISAPETPTTLNFLPDNHIVLIYRAQILKHFEDLWEKLGNDLPRSVNLITGPSRTADIEQTIQLGAHGPRRLHVIVINKQAASF